MPKRPSDEGQSTQLPAIVEGALSFMEGLARERVSFLWVETTSMRGCQFCGLSTTMRLQAKSRDDEITVQIICPGCRSCIIEAPVA